MTEAKTGKVARIFGIDPKTITGWVDRYPEFFSSDARADEAIHRVYHPEDLVALNTIHNERAKGTDWEEIRAKMVAGERDTNLPPEATAIEGDRAIAVYIELNQLKTELGFANAEVSRLRSELDRERDNQKELYMRIGRLEAHNDILRSQIKEMEEKKGQGDA